MRWLSIGIGQRSAALGNNFAAEHGQNGGVVVDQQQLVGGRPVFGGGFEEKPVGAIGS
jgi:hypothetical protein